MSIDFTDVQEFLAKPHDAHLSHAEDPRAVLSYARFIAAKLDAEMEEKSLTGPEFLLMVLSVLKAMQMSTNTNIRITLATAEQAADLASERRKQAA